MIRILPCDFTQRTHREAIILLMNDYMADNMGGNLPPYTDDLADKVINGLENHPSSLVLLAQESDRIVGLANCFVNFGTFAGKPFINIHDLVVLSGQRGKGIGRQLMKAITEKACELGCAKITLEVREDNVYAQRLYKKMGYKESEPPMYFWTKYL